MHPLVQQFLFEKLQVSGQLAALHGLHLAYFRTYVEETTVPLDYGDHVHPLNQLALEHENIRLALDWGLRQPVSREALQLVRAMFPFWDIRYHTEEGLEFTTRAVATLSQGELWASLKLQQLRFLERQRWAAEDEIAIRAVLEFAESNDNNPLQLAALQRLSAHYSRSRSPKYLATAKRYVTVADEVQNRNVLAQALDNLATALIFANDFSTGVETYRQALQVARQNEDDVWVARISYNLALELYFRQNNRAEALPLIQESLALKRLLGDRGGMITRLYMLARLAIAKGELQLAGTQLQEGEKIAREINDPKRQCELHFARARFFAAQQRWSDAIPILRKALVLAQDSQHHFYHFSALAELAISYLRVGLPHQAKEQLKKHIELASSLALKRPLDAVHLTFSDYFDAIGDFQQSARQLLIHQRESAAFPNAENEPTIRRIESSLNGKLSAEEWTQLRDEVELVTYETFLAEISALLSS